MSCLGRFFCPSFRTISSQEPSPFALKCRMGIQGSTPKTTPGRSNSLGTPSPRSSRRWNFKISVTGAVTRHGVINWEEFGENFCWVVLHSEWSTKMPRKFRQYFAQFFAQLFAQDFARSKKCVATISLWGMSGLTNSPKIDIHMTGFGCPGWN